MNTTRRVRQYHTSHWLLFSFFLAVSITIHQVYRSELQSFSMNKLLECQSVVAQYNFFKVFSMYFVSYINECVICFLLLLVYNFGNIFKFIILLTSLQVSFLILSVFQLVYLSDKPLLIHDAILVHSGNLPFGDPSIRILLSTVFYLTLHQITFRSSRFEGKAYLKVLFFVVILLFLLGLSALTWITAINSMEQIVFGFALGYCVYFFTFFVLNINSNNSKQLSKLVNFPIYYYFLLVLSIIVGYNVFFLLRYDSGAGKRLNELELEDRSRGVVINRYLSLYNGSALLFILALSNIGTILGLKAEYKFLFGSNYVNWLQYNFEKEEDKDDDDSLYSKLCINKDIQWNHTSLSISIARLTVLCLFISLLILPFKYLRLPIDNFLIFLGKVCIITNSICFGLCFVYKQFLKWLKVTNITLFTIIRESI